MATLRSRTRSPSTRQIGSQVREAQPVRAHHLACHGFTLLTGMSPSSLYGDNIELGLWRTNTHNGVRGSHGRTTPHRRSSLRRRRVRHGLGRGETISDSLATRANLLGSIKPSTAGLCPPPNQYCKVPLRRPLLPLRRSPLYVPVRPLPQKQRQQPGHIAPVVRPLPHDPGLWEGLRRAGQQVSKAAWGGVVHTGHGAAAGLDVCEVRAHRDDTGPLLRGAVSAVRLLPTRRSSYGKLL